MVAPVTGEKVPGSQDFGEDSRDSSQYDPGGHTSQGVVRPMTFDDVPRPQSKHFLSP